VQGFLVRYLALIFGFQAGDFLFAQVLPHLEPCCHDAGQAEGEFPVQVDIHPLGILLLGFNCRNPMYHLLKSAQPLAAFSSGPRLRNNKPGLPSVPALVQGKGTDKLSRTGNGSVTYGGNAGRSFVFYSTGSTHRKNPYSLQTLRLPKKTALISGQVRTHDFQEFYFLNRGRSCKAFPKSGVNLFRYDRIIHETAVLSRNSGLQEIIFTGKEEQEKKILSR
jgi:hypothetical protein